ncbi:spore coat protein YsxE [Fredinandcohnia humi]
MGKSNKNFGPILRYYNVKPSHIEDYGSIKKVVTEKGIFALKTISKAVNQQFPTLVQHLFQQGYTRAVPIYPTVDGRYLVFYDQSYHYLMPWLTNNSNQRSDRHQELCKELARMHLSTLRKHKLEDGKEITAYYEKVVNKWDETSQYLESFVEAAEKKWYMSPFELQVCTYFHEANLASRFSRTQFDKWYETILEKKSYRTALTHGKVSINHLLFDDYGKGYFTNFERATFANPIHDLVDLNYRRLKTYPLLCDDCVTCYETYRTHFSLRDEEVSLFLSFLTYPEPIYRCVRIYEENKHKTEREHVQLLQRAYWLIKNIEYVSVKILEAEGQRKEQKETNEEESHT